MLLHLWVDTYSGDMSASSQDDTHIYIPSFFFSEGYFVEERPFLCTSGITCTIVFERNL